MTVRPRDNPFRAQRLDAIEFEPQGMSWDEVIGRLDGCRWRGAIVGRRGSGKTTLMRGLRAIAKDRGWDVRHVFLRDDLRVEAEAWTAALAELTKQSVVFVDGFDHLWWWRRVEAITRTSRVGLVVTGHRRMVLMRTVVRTQTSVDLLAGLVRGLVGEGEIEAVDRAEVGAMYRTHGGNVRDALWAFYDRWAEG